jgi:hypothetical protein
MDPGLLLNLLVGALALLGWVVLIFFLIEFRGDVSIHPIYRAREGSAQLQSNPAIGNREGSQNEKLQVNRTKVNSKQAKV